MVAASEVDPGQGEGASSGGRRGVPGSDAGLQDGEGEREVDGGVPPERFGVRRDEQGEEGSVGRVGEGAGAKGNKRLEDVIDKTSSEGWGEAGQEGEGVVAGVGGGGGGGEGGEDVGYLEVVVGFDGGSDGELERGLRVGWRTAVMEMAAAAEEEEEAQGFLIPCGDGHGQASVNRKHFGVEL